MNLRTSLAGSIAVLFLGLAPPPLRGATPQNILYVDGLNGPYTSITSAMMAANAGDTIRVFGMEDPATGLPLGYSEDFSEVFPIALKEDVVVEGYGNKTVYVWSSAGSALFTVAPASGTSAEYHLANMTLIGGDSAFLLESDDGNTYDVFLKTLRFSRNRIACSVLASQNSTVNLELRKCWIVEETVSPPPPYIGPVLRPQHTGISLVSSETAGGNGPGQVVADVLSLRTDGAFDGLDTSPGAGSLLVLRASGESAEHLGVPGRHPVSLVRASLQGGVLDGAATVASPGGWRRGIDAVAASTAATRPQDYTAAVEVELVGSQLRNFRETGVFMDAPDDTRGQVALNIGATVEWTGAYRGTSGPPTADPWDGTGIYMNADGGYLALLAEDPAETDAPASTVRDNWRDGIYLYATYHYLIEQSANQYPFGAFVDLERTEIYRNKRDGFHAIAEHGIAGGTLTWDQDDHAHILWGGYRDPGVPYGQGVMNRCTVNNNGRKGIHFELSGTSWLAQDAGYGCMRIVNTYVWNNAEDGFHASLLNGLLLTPMVHCVSAGNGNLQGTFEAEVVLDPLGQSTFGWSEEDPPNSGNIRHLHTMFYDSIYQRKVSTGDCFGPGIDAHKEYDPAGDQLNNLQIGMAGLRTTFRYESGATGLDSFWTDKAAPFIGLAGGQVQWVETAPQQFFLDTNHQDFDPYFSQTPPYLNLEAGESAFDFLNDPRPPLSFSNRHKGARQNP